MECPFNPFDTAGSNLKTEMPDECNDARYQTCSLHIDPGDELSVDLHTGEGANKRMIH